MSTDSATSNRCWVLHGTRRAWSGESFGQLRQSPVRALLTANFEAALAAPGCELVDEVNTGPPPLSSAPSAMMASARRVELEAARGVRAREIVGSDDPSLGLRSIAAIAM